MTELPDGMVGQHLWASFGRNVMGSVSANPSESIEFGRSRSFAIAPRNGS